MYNIMAKHPFISAAHNIWQKSAIFLFPSPKERCHGNQFFVGCIFMSRQISETA